MRIRFSTSEEFLEELAKEAKAHEVDEDILRLTFHYQQSGQAPLTFMSVVVGAVVRGKIIELHQYIGQTMDTLYPHSASDKVRERAEAIKTKIETQARALDLEVRAGMFAP
jgi:hypothetical protein